MRKKAKEKAYIIESERYKEKLILRNKKRNKAHIFFPSFNKVQPKTDRKHLMENFEVKKSAKFNLRRGSLQAKSGRNDESTRTMIKDSSRAGIFGSQMKKKVKIKNSPKKNYPKTYIKLKIQCPNKNKTKAKI